MVNVLEQVGWFVSLGLPHSGSFADACHGMRHFWEHRTWDIDIDVMYHHIHQLYIINSIYYQYWLVVWNMNFMTSLISWECQIIPSDEVIFFRGVGRYTTNQLLFISISSPIIHPIFIRKYGWPPINSAYLGPGRHPVEATQEKNAKGRNHQAVVGWVSRGEPLSWVELWHFWGSISNFDRKRWCETAQTAPRLVIYAARSGMDADHGGMSSGLDTKSSLVKEKKHFSGGLPPRNQPGFINAGLTLHGLGKNQPRCSLNQEVWIYSIYEGEAAEKEGKNQSFKRNFDLDP